MTENDIIRKRFEEKGFDKISEFCRGINSSLTQESWGKLLYRDKPVSTELLLRMAGEVGCPPEEIKDMMLKRGEVVIAGLIAPAAMSTEDRRFLSKLHLLNDKQKKAIFDMMTTLAGG